MSIRSARKVSGKNWHQAAEEKLTLGQRSADRLRNFMGSWGFVFGFIAFMIVWAALNSFTRGWDPYPFILLNLFLSMLAGLQGAILLISAKRQDAIAATLAQSDYDTNVAAKTDVEHLLQLIEDQSTMLKDLREFLEGETQKRPADSGATSDANAAS